MSIADLLEELSHDDRPLAYLELEKDIVFPHLTPAARLHYMNHALQAGRRQAMLSREDVSHSTDVFRLADRLKAWLISESTQSGVPGVMVRAAYDPATRTITLYEPSIDEMHNLLCSLLPEPWDKERIVRLHVAHELFHHLETIRIKSVHEQLPPVPICRIGPVCVTEARARQCREIAAHAFAKELLGLPFLPSAVDWLVLIAQRKWSVVGLQAALDRARDSIAQAQRGSNLQDDAQVEPRTKAPAWRPW